MSWISFVLRDTDSTAVANAVKFKRGMSELSVNVTPHSSATFLKEAYGIPWSLFRILLHKLPGPLCMKQQTEIMLSIH